MKEENAKEILPRPPRNPPRSPPRNPPRSPPPNPPRSPPPVMYYFMEVPIYLVTYLFHVLRHHRGHHENLFSRHKILHSFQSFFLDNTWSSHHFNINSNRYESSRKNRSEHFQFSKNLNRFFSYVEVFTEDYKGIHLPITVHASSSYHEVEKMS